MFMRKELKRNKEGWRVGWFLFVKDYVRKWVSNEPNETVMVHTINAPTGCIVLDQWAELNWVQQRK